VKFNASIALLLRVVTAVILLQALYLKFSAHPESVFLFTELGAEPWGRIATACIESIIVVLLIIPYTSYLGALAGIGLMLGAIFAQLIVVGLGSGSDGGELLMLALVVLLCCIVTIWLQKEEGMVRFRRIFRRK